MIIVIVGNDVSDGLDLLVPAPYGGFGQAQQLLAYADVKGSLVATSLGPPVVFIVI